VYVLYLDESGDENNAADDDGRNHGLVLKQS